MTFTIFIFCKDHRAQGGTWIGGGREDQVAVPGGGLQSAEVRGSGRQWRDRGGVGRLSPGEIKTHRTWRQIKVGDVGRREGGAEHLGKGRRAVEERAGRLWGASHRLALGRMSSGGLRGLWAIGGASLELRGGPL